MYVSIIQPVYWHICERIHIKLTGLTFTQSWLSWASVQCSPRLQSLWSGRSRAVTRVSPPTITSSHSSTRRFMFHLSKYGHSHSTEPAPVSSGGLCLSPPPPMWLQQRSAPCRARSPTNHRAAPGTWPGPRPASRCSLFTFAAGNEGEGLLTVRTGPRASRGPPRRHSCNFLWWSTFWRL